MLEQIFTGLELSQILIASLVFVLFTGFAWVFSTLIVKWFYRLLRNVKSRIYKTLISLSVKPIVAMLTVAGLLIAAVFLPFKPAIGVPLIRVLSTALSLLGIYLFAALINEVIKWYTQGLLRDKKEAGFNRRTLQLVKLFIVFVALFGGVVVTLEIWNVSLTPVTTWLIAHGWRIGLMLGIMVIFIIAIGELMPKLIMNALIRREGETESEFQKRGITLSRVLVSVGQISAILITAFMILSELNINIAPILAGVGVAGIALGFGAQSLVKDLLAGLFIILENQYRVGDVVRIADVAGLVEDINLRRTILRDLDGIVHVVPNGEIRVASNFTRGWARVNVNVAVAYEEDLERVISIINRVGGEMAADPQWAPAIIKAPSVLRVDNLGPSGVEIKILGDTQPIKQWDVMGELRLRLKKAFDAEGIKFSWPHTKVYFADAPPPKFGASKNE